MGYGTTFVPRAFLLGRGGGLVHVVSRCDYTTCYLIGYESHLKHYEQYCLAIGPGVSTELSPIHAFFFFMKQVWHEAGSALEAGTLGLYFFTKLRC